MNWIYKKNKEKKDTATHLELLGWEFYEYFEGYNQTTTFH